MMAKEEKKEKKKSMNRFKSWEFINHFATLMKHPNIIHLLHLTSHVNPPDSPSTTPLTLFHHRTLFIFHFAPLFTLLVSNFFFLSFSIFWKGLRPETLNGARLLHSHDACVGKSEDSFGLIVQRNNDWLEVETQSRRAFIREEVEAFTPHSGSLSCKESWIDRKRNLYRKSSSWDFFFFATSSHPLPGCHRRTVITIVRRERRRVEIWKVNKCSDVTGLGLDGRSPENDETVKLETWLRKWGNYFSALAWWKHLSWLSRWLGKVSSHLFLLLFLLWWFIFYSFLLA